MDDGKRKPVEQDSSDTECEGDAGDGDRSKDATGKTAKDLLDELGAEPGTLVFEIVSVVQAATASYHEPEPSGRRAQPVATARASRKS